MELGEVVGAHQPHETAGGKPALERAERVVVVADSSKVGRVLPGSIAPVSAVHVLVTDDGITTEFKAALEARGVEVVIA